MLEKSLNRKPDFNLTMSEKKGQLVCTFGYSVEFVSVEETITFTKVGTQTAKELLLAELMTPVFGYRSFGERMMFDLDSTVLDFRPFDDYTRYPNFSDFDKFRKAKKIIMSTDSKVFCGFCNTPVSKMKANCECKCDLLHPHIGMTVNRLIPIYNNIGRVGNISFVAQTGRIPLLLSDAVDDIVNTNVDTALRIGQIINRGNRLFESLFPDQIIRCVNGRPTRMANYMDNYIIPLNHFNHTSVYMPSIIEVEVYCCEDVEINFTQFGELPNLERNFTKFGSLPNLVKLSLIRRDNTKFRSPFLDIHDMISTSPNKKLKHLILKNMSTWIKPDTLDKAKLSAQVNHIRLEII